MEAQKSEIIERLKQTNGKIFFVEFKKKNGETRRMTARLNVSKGVKGIGMSYNPAEKDLMCVYNMDKNGFRMINLGGIQMASMFGAQYRVR